MHALWVLAMSAASLRVKVMFDPRLLQRVAELDNGRILGYTLAHHHSPPRVHTPRHARCTRAAVLSVDPICSDRVTVIEK